MIKKIISNDSGFLLATLLIVMLAFTAMAFSLTSYSVSQLNRTVRETYSANAVGVAEAGIEASLASLNQDNDFTGYATEQEFFDDSTQGRGIYTTEVEDTADTDAKTITSIGKVYRYNQSDTPVSTKKIRVTVVGTGSDGYAVHTGPGGLILGGSANVTNSDVYANGFITLNGASRIGTSAQPADVKVANMKCPPGNNPGPTYPQVCTSGDPITFAYSTTIYGTVCATHQVSTGPRPGGNILPGSGGLGFQAGCVAPPVTTPSYNKAAHEANVAITAAGNSNTYVCNSWPFNRTWPANLKLTGNVTVGGSCNVRIYGDAYITGNLTINGASRITVDDSVGADRPVFLVDGNITTGGSAQIIANNQGTGIHFISYKSSASCGSNCTTLTGNDLKNSQGVETVTVGGAVNLPGMIFQSYWGKAALGGSGNVGSIIGQTVDMQGAGTVTFGTTLSSGSTTWTISSYQRLPVENE